MDLSKTCEKLQCYMKKKPNQTNYYFGNLSSNLTDLLTGGSVDLLLLRISAL